MRECARVYMYIYVHICWQYINYLHLRITDILSITLISLKNVIITVYFQAFHVAMREYERMREYGRICENIREYEGI